MQAAVQQGFAGTHGDFVEARFETGGAQRAFDHIIITDRNAAAGHQHVQMLGALGDAQQRFRIILHHAQVKGLAAVGGDEGREGRAVAGDDLAVGDGIAWRYHFIAGGQHADDRTAGHGDTRQVHGGDDADVAGVEALG